MRRNFPGELRRHLDFIRRSAQLFDQGLTDESLRIAVSVRVILHDTGSSTSLLSHLNARDISLLSTCGGIPEGQEPFFYFGLGVVSIGAGGVRYRATVSEQDSPRDYLPVERWWQQVVWIPQPGMSLRRRDLVLIAANKVGGAHVDDSVPDEYMALVEAPFGSIFDSVAGPERPSDVHLHALRLIGEELLNSADLMALQSPGGEETR